MEPQSSTETVAQRVKKVFIDLKGFLGGHEFAENAIQSVLDSLRSEDGDTAYVDVLDGVTKLMLKLSSWSSQLVRREIFEVAMRVEVVIRLLVSTLQKFNKDPLHGLEHLERLCRDRDYFDEEIASYGYAGVRLMGTGSLQIVASELMDSGKAALEKTNIREPPFQISAAYVLGLPSLVDAYGSDIMFEVHFAALGSCFQGPGRIPWFEASVNMISDADSRVKKPRLYDLGKWLHSEAARARHSDLAVEFSQRAVSHFKAFLELCDHNTGKIPFEELLLVAKAHQHIGQLAYDLNDVPLSLQHLAKGVGFAADNSLHEEESEICMTYGAVLLKKMPDKEKEVRVYSRKALEAAVKISHSTEVSLSIIHRACKLVQISFRLPCPSRDIRPPSFFEGRPYQSSTVQILTESPPSWTTTHARAELYLGYVSAYDSKPAKVVEMLYRGLRILEAEPISSRIERNLAALLHSALGRIHYNTAKFDKAASHFHISAQMHDDQTDEKAEGLMEASALFHSAEYDAALEITEALLQQASINSDLAILRGEILSLKGAIELSKRDIEKSILSLERARECLEENNRFHAPFLAGVYIHLVQAYLTKHDYYTAHGLMQHFDSIMDTYHKESVFFHCWQAIKAGGHSSVGDFESAESAMDEFPIDVLEDPKWRGLEALGMTIQADNLYGESAQEEFGTLENLINESRDPGSRPDIIVPDYAERGVALARIRLRLAKKLMRPHTRDLENAIDLSQEAIYSFREKPGQEILLAEALACRAQAIYNLWCFNREVNPSSDVQQTIDEAIQLVQTRDRVLLATFKYLKAYFICTSDTSAAEAEGREAALIFAELQLQLKDMESAWVTMFGSKWKEIFIFMETLLVDMQQPMKALLWAERGRRRLFAYLTRTLRDTDFPDVKDAALDCGDEHVGALQQLTLNRDPLCRPEQDLWQVSSSEEESHKQSNGRAFDGPPADSTKEPLTESMEETDGNAGDAGKLHVGLDDLWFDRDDARAEKYLFQAVEQCGPEALILVYTFADLENLIIYAVFIDSEGRHVVESKFVKSVDAIIQGRTKKWGTSLSTLIRKTRSLILQKNDSEAKEGLSLLHSFFIEPVQKYLNGYKRLILAVHEDLVLVPFAALYNEQSRKFLVQEKVISYIPSIRALSYCFSRQRKFEQDRQRGSLKDPFIAGNPEPMGCTGYDDLPGAAEEAQVVAQILGGNVKPCIGPRMTRILGVRPCEGRSMTKEAVKDALSTSSMVLLATHGVVDNNFPHGALILQGSDKSSSHTDEDYSTPLAVLAPSLLRGRPNGLVTHKWRNEVITANELATLPGGIRAGLVVLSACQSGAGEVTSEGLLGLGPSLLLGGAPVAMLMLWNVGDFSNKVLIAGMFEQLVKRGKDAAEAVQLTMQQRIADKAGEYNIYHWAPLVMLGSPIFKYVHRASHALGME